MKNWFAMLHGLRECWRDLLVFEVLYKLLQTAVFTPIVVWMTTMLVRSTGRLAISNTEIVSFLLSPLGLLIGAAGLFSGNARLANWVAVGLTTAFAAFLLTWRF